MNCARVFYDYDGRRRGWALTCTCGHFERFKDSHLPPSKCPSCENANVQAEYRFLTMYEKSRKMTFKNIEKIVVEPKRFYVRKRNVSTKIEGTEKCDFAIHVLKEELFETYFDAERNRIQIFCNEIEINPTKHNIQKALSNIPIDAQFKNSIFYDYFEFHNEKYTLSNIVLDFIDYPQYEIFYNTYGTFDGIKNLKKKHFKSGTSPSEIIGVNKTIWNCIYDINKELNQDGRIYLQFDDILPFVARNKTKPDHINKVLEIASKIDIIHINKMIELYEWGFNPDRVFEYLTEDIYTYQGIESPLEGLQLLYDYVRMNKLLGVEFEKYPKSLKLRHDLTNKNLKIQISDIEVREMELVLTSDIYKSLTYKGKKYSVIIPETANDIINEGKQLSHCVDSYVDLVKNKKTMIVFMRDNSNISKPLITLEVKNDTLRQYAGFGDRHPNEEEMKFIKEYCKAKNLSINDKHAMYLRE